MSNWRGLSYHSTQNQPTLSRSCRAFFFFSHDIFPLSVIPSSVSALCRCCCCCCIFFLSHFPVLLQVDPDSLCPDDMFIEQMGSLLEDDEHCDVTFFVGASKTEVRHGWRMRKQDLSIMTTLSQPCDVETCWYTYIHTYMVFYVSRLFDNSVSVHVSAVCRALSHMCKIFSYLNFFLPQKSR